MPAIVAMLNFSTYVRREGTSVSCQMGVSNGMPGFRSRPITFSVRPAHCAATIIYLRSITASEWWRPQRRFGISHVAARSKRARRYAALHFLVAKAPPFDRVDFINSGRALDRGQRMLELWNYWYDILASAEALAGVIVIVVLGAGVITLAQGRRR